jgi:hypothetical protein
MAEGFLDGEQVHPAQIQLRGAEVPQDVRGQCLVPFRQVRRGGPGQPGPQRLGAGPGVPLAGQQRGPVTGEVVAEQPPHVLDEPPQRPVRPVDQRHHPLSRPGPAGALAVTDVKLAEPAQVPADVVQVQHAGLVDPQPDLRHQPCRRVVPGGRRELPARRELFPPAREQLLDLAGLRRDPQRRPAAAPRPVHLIERALGDMARELVDLGLMAQLQEREPCLDRLRPLQPRVGRRSPHHLPEVHVGVGRRHFPQRPAEPRPHLLQVRHVAADRAVGQARRRPRQHEPRQHVGLERRRLFRPCRDTRLPHVPHHRQAHPVPRSPSSLSSRQHHRERSNFSESEEASIDEHEAGESQEAWPKATSRTPEPGTTPGNPELIK